MNYKRMIIAASALLACCCINVNAQEKAPPKGNDLILEQSFKSPPDSAKPYTWWHWVNGNVSKEGITKDLEAMKAVGLGGSVLFDCSVGIPAGPVKYNSKQDHQLRSFAIAEADRLGLDAGFNNASGWSSTGGPWVTPEHSMKMVAWSETTVGAGDSDSDHMAL